MYVCIYIHSYYTNRCLLYFIVITTGISDLGKNINTDEAAALGMFLKMNFSRHVFSKTDPFN